ncbi:MAG: hypothetical protein Q7S66_04575 [bacterium]|nr:hypothetical protein [bacterium]
MFKTAFLDLDWTIYNCKRLEADMLAVMAKYGVSEDDYKQTYHKSLRTVGQDLFDYSFEEHIDFLAEIGYKLDGELLADLNDLFKKDYLFPGSLEFIRFFKIIARQTVLLTAGDPKFQRTKIDRAGIGGMFDKVEIVPGNKVKYLIEQKFPAPIIFINDNLSENIAIHAARPDIIVVTKANLNRTTLADLQASGIPFFYTLEEIIDYVSKLK